MFTPQFPFVRTKRNPQLFDSPPTFCIYPATLNVKMASVSQNCVVTNFDSIISDITVDGRANASLMVQFYYFTNVIASFCEKSCQSWRIPFVIKTLFGLKINYQCFMTSPCSADSYTRQKQKLITSIFSSKFKDERGKCEQVSIYMCSRGTLQGWLGVASFFQGSLGDSSRARKSISVEKQRQIGWTHYFLHRVGACMMTRQRFSPTPMKKP